MVASLAGARLMHIVYENFSYYLESPLKILYFWEGGFVFYGGMIMALSAAVIYLRWIRTPQPGLYFDAFAPVLSFAYGFGRVGCFMAGCCFGQTCDAPWAIGQRHPTQLYALLWELGTIFILLGLEKKDSSQRLRFVNRSGDLFVLWLGLHALGRMLMESFRDDFRGDQILGYSVSTILSLCLLLLALSILGGFGRGLLRIFGKKN